MDAQDDLECQKRYANEGLEKRTVGELRASGKMPRGQDDASLS